MHPAARTDFWSNPQSEPRRSSAAAASSSSGTYMSEGLEGLDFYAILGVMPSADSREVRRAYLSLIKQLHPDLSTAREGGEALEAASLQLCTLVNEIYEVLGDEAKRAAYDALAGFSVESVNPFLDTSFQRDQVFVDEVRGW
jgi:hypothetical protein